MISNSDIQMYVSEKMSAVITEDYETIPMKSSFITTIALLLIFFMFSTLSLISIVSKTILLFVCEPYLACLLKAYLTAQKNEGYRKN